ncbi:MAG: phosphodiester glycosidase family protein [Patescibacteria group bacterium]
MNLKRFFALGCLAMVCGGVALGLLFAAYLPTMKSVLRYGYADLPAFMERRITSFDGHEVSFLVSKFSADSQWSFANDPFSPRSVHEWRKNLGATFVMNGSYFTETNQPAGFYSINGADSIVAWPNVAFDENGYTFAVNITPEGTMNMYHVPASSMLGPYPGSTFLSFPTLILNDTPMVAEDSGLHARRTVLAQEDDGTIDVVVSESGEVSLYQMAQWLSQQPEHFRIAGNLDGGPSTGISTSSSPWDIEVQSAAVPNVVVVQ